MAEIKSHAFWLSYAPAHHESLEDVIELVDRVVIGKPGVWAGETTREGQNVVDMIICTPMAQRVKVVCGEIKWKRKGARGRVCDARWPEPYQPVDVFLHTWADAMTAGWRRTAGSRESVFAALSRHRIRDRERKKVGRIRKKRGSTETAAVVSTTPVLEASTEESETPVQVDGPGTDLGCQSGDFAGIDFGPPAPCPGPSTECEALDLLDLILEHHGIPLSETSLWEFGCDADLTMSCATETVHLDMSMKYELDWNAELPMTDIVL
ncbi:hypothetical protein HIM_12076 [Hirsutella minnesotensis 3608]|uniref:Uncharacterized protein n=1 Tax=Hirsutella minnesotensis 3608 TaxID=1043627 RepID=A0A0F7ZW86_9HYPO|nr:hypothetical protein HIM_12076 [Hirsutella minnesotensis 3608]